MENPKERDGVGIVDHDLRVSLILEQAGQVGTGNEKDNSDNIITFYLGRRETADEISERTALLTPNKSIMQETQEALSQTMQGLMDEDTNVEGDDVIRGIKRESSFRKKWREKIKLDQELKIIRRQGEDQDDDEITNKRNPFNGDL